MKGLNWRSGPLAWLLALGVTALLGAWDIATSQWRDPFLILFPWLALCVVFMSPVPALAATLLAIGVAEYITIVHHTFTVLELWAGPGITLFMAGTISLSAQRVRHLLHEKDVLLVQERQHRARAEEAYLAQIDAERRRDRLVQDAAHQLRTPLTVLTGFAQVLAELEEVPAYKVDPSQRMRTAAVEKILRAAQAMDFVVQDILDAAMLPQGGADAWEDTLDPDRPLPPDAQPSRTILESY